MKQEDDFDELLSEALRDVREAEPRVGLEGRVLAGVRGRAGESKVAWWRWVAVAAAVILIVAVVGVRRGAKNDVAVKGPVKAAPEKKVEEVVKVETPKPNREVQVKRVAKMRPKKGPEAVLIAAERVPFPVPTPLTEEEKVLQRWAGKKPEVLVKLNEEKKEAEEKPIMISPLETDPINGGEK